ncbi:GGDEF domain-containing protein [Hyphococcus flavus]|uniref:diguanylate cyclase n=1 Tax=Hyphococcus flavus TaxID=1866326 RepID=A0AAF0CH25_9PROT|nr:GGDEF domain-containing protein [Hyphococcus flavus]WDI31437.1 GGDEF domain-containing protein [Hyphococcus flavus]
MKIGDASKAYAGVKVGRRPAAGGVRSEGVTTLSDQTVISGVPEAELTPKVREALTALMSEVQSLRAELAEARDRVGNLEKLADRDPLLDVFNRRAFVRELDRTMAMIDRYDMRASLVFIDLNDLKKINDSMGHHAGDAALRHIASVISSNIRQTDVLGRLGGDEFGLLLTQADQATAEHKAEELSRAVSASPVSWKGDAFTASVSCGVVEIIKGHSVDETMERADSAMYDVKSRKNAG